MENTSNGESSGSLQRDDEREPAAICRLRHGLNDNCLLNVFDYLNENDLLNLCEMDPYYKELILKWTIKDKCLDLRDTRKHLKMFEAFGKSMRKLNIYSSTFVVTFAVLMKYCKPGQLTEVEIDIHDVAGYLGEGDRIDALSKITLMSMPVFYNLRRLRFQVYSNSDVSKVYTNLLTQISTAAEHLHSLEIDHLHIRGNWLENMRNLKELRITLKGTSSLDSILSYLKSKPDLKVFKLLHQHPNLTSVYDALAECCPNLETFTDIDRNWTSPYVRFDTSLTKRYAFFSKFSHLNDVTLMTYTFCGSDLYYPLVKLAAQNITKLRIVTCSSRPIVLSKEVKDEIMCRSIPHFDQLVSLEVQLAALNSPGIFNSKYTCCDLRCEFLVHFLRHANNLQHLALSGSTLSKIEKMLTHLPSVRVLDLSRVHLIDLFRDVSNIVKTVLGSPERLTRKGPFHVILTDDEKVQYFKQQNDMKDIINFTFKSRDRWNKWDL